MRLAEDHTADALAHLPQALTQRLDFGDDGRSGCGGGRPGRDANLDSGAFTCDLSWQKPVRTGDERGLLRSRSIAAAPGNPGETGSLASGAAKPDASICGDFNIRIARDGSWFYHGSPIGRKPLVKLFAKVLRRDDAGQYWLITPVERGTIVVDDAPFVAVELSISGSGRSQRLTFRTNLDDEVSADADHRFASWKTVQVASHRPMFWSATTSRLSFPAPSSINLSIWA